MVVLTMAGITIGALMALGYPLLGRARWRGAEAPEGSEAHLVLRKTSIYQDIKDLELDREMGKVAPADYRAMRTAYEAEAAQVLAAIEKQQEEEAGARCPGCSRVPGPEARFCPFCGHGLEEGCPSCGEPVTPQDRFCTGCGHALART